MGISVFLSSPAPLTGDETLILRRALQNLADTLPWGCEPFSLTGANQVDGLFIAVKVQNDDADVLWRDCLQVAALGLVASRALPQRLFKVDDDLDLLASEVGCLSLRGGTAGESDGALRAAIAETLDPSLFGLTASAEPVAPASLSQDATLVFPSEGQGEPVGYTNRPWVQAFTLTQQAPDDEGDIGVDGIFQLRNDDTAAHTLGVVVRLFDADDRLLGVFEDDDGPVAAGGSVELSSTTWVEGDVARAEVWVTRTLRREGPVQPELHWSGPDEEGDHACDVHVPFHCTEVPTQVVLRLHWATGESEELSAERVATGHQLLRFSAYQFASDPDGKREATVTATLARDTVHSWRGPDAPGKALPVAAETMDAVPADEPAKEVAPDAGPWELVEAGRVDEALQVLHSLDSDGRTNTRRLMDSDKPSEVISGLRIATHTNWRSAVTVARRLLHHDDPGVREQACRTCGEMGGPSLVIPLRASLRDPDPRVRRAADAAIALIED